MVRFPIEAHSANVTRWVDQDEYSISDKEIEYWSNVADEEDEGNSAMVILYVFLFFVAAGIVAASFIL